MRLTGISFKVETNYPAITIGKHTFVFSRHYWFNTKHPCRGQETVRSLDSQGVRR